MHQHLWDTAQAVLKRKFIAVNVYIKKTERPQIYNLVFYFKTPEKEKQGKSKTIKGKNIIHIRVETN
jgi:hypothetical protein